MENMSRRKFMQIVSTIAFSTSLSALFIGCGDNSQRTVNGPIIIDVGTTKVTAMYYQNSQSALVDLHSAQDVPVNSHFEITFSAAMKTDSLFLLFVDKNNNKVSYNVVWPDSSTAVITPTTALQPVTQYSLAVSAGIDTTGKEIAQLDSARFTTA